MNNTLQMINDYPYELVVWRNKLWTKEDLTELVNKLQNKINPQTLHDSIACAMKKTSNWTWDPNKIVVDYEKVMEEMLNA